MSNQKTVIIKQVKKKSGGGGHHGGSWKVAYADFVTGMMAFFLLMWLLTMTAPERRARVATYFKHFSIFEQSGSSFMSEEAAILSETGGEMSIPKENTRRSEPEEINTATISPEQLQGKLREEIQAKLAGMEDQVIIEVFSGGVRIQLVDKAGQPLFPLGGSTPTPLGMKMLEAVAESIRDVPNTIAIEGHTDALSYSSNRYTNWELSTDRASAARKELEVAGLNPDKLALVAGYAATSPLIRDNPNDPRNRRISIIIRYSGGGSGGGEKGAINAPALSPEEGS